jgi:hypothetical protein
LIATERPWIKADISPGGPVRYDVNGVSFTLRFVLKNIGHSPAMNVWIMPRVIAPAIGIDPVGFNPRKELEKDIVALKTKAPSPFALAIFPGDTITEDITVNISAAELARITQKAELIMPTIIGAIDYRFGFDAQAHETGFIVEVRRDNAPRPMTVEKNRWPPAIFPDEGDIPAADVRLFSSFIDGGYAD